MPGQEGNTRGGVERRNPRDVDQGTRPFADQGLEPLPPLAELLNNIKDQLSSLLDPVKQILEYFCPFEQEKAPSLRYYHHPPPYECLGSSPFPPVSR
jgi:hypothetical protein